MGVRSRTIYEGTCDSCDNPIEEGERYVDASVYGAAFHTGCFQAMHSLNLIKALGLDDIYLTNLGEEVRGEKLAYFKGKL